MAIRKLFISHSSKTPVNLELLKDVCTGLKQAGFHLLVDRNGEFGDRDVAIHPGSDWDLLINEWMAECHAAVILFSTAALEDSDWVKKEGAILSWRREIEEDFKLIPVLLDNITAEALQGGLNRVLRITKSQCISSDKDATAIVTKLKDGLGTPTPTTRTPFERLEEVLGKLLKTQADANTLEDTWNKLDSPVKPVWQPERGERFAGALARFLIRDSRNVLMRLKALLDHIRPRVEKDAAEELVKYLACFWVDARAAAGIPAAHNRSGIVGLNGNYLTGFTARRYGERAWPLTDRWRYIPVDGQSRSPDSVLDVIRGEFRPRGARVPDAAVDRRIRSYQDPIVVLLPSPEEHPQLPDKRLLAALHESYPNIIYLIGMGPEVPQDVPPEVEPLQPPLDTSLEEKMFFELDDVQKFIDEQLYGGL